MNVGAANEERQFLIKRDGIGRIDALREKCRRERERACII